MLNGRWFDGSAPGAEKNSYRQGSLDSSTMFRAPKRLLSPVSVPESSHNPRHHRNKSKKIDTSLRGNDRQPHSAPNQRFMGWRNRMQARGLVLTEWCNYKFRELDPAQLDDLTLRDACRAAKHTVNVAKLKRLKAQKMLYKADLAIQKASSAMMLADAIKASSANSTNDASFEN